MITSYDIIPVITSYAHTPSLNMSLSAHQLAFGKGRHMPISNELYNAISVVILEILTLFAASVIIGCVIYVTLLKIKHFPMDCPYPFRYAGAGSLYPAWYAWELFTPPSTLWNSVPLPPEVTGTLYPSLQR